MPPAPPVPAVPVVAEPPPPPPTPGRPELVACAAVPPLPPAPAVPAVPPARAVPNGAGARRASSSCTRVRATGTTRTATSLHVVTELGSTTVVARRTSGRVGRGATATRANRTDGDGLAGTQGGCRESSVVDRATTTASATRGERAGSHDRASAATATGTHNSHRYMRCTSGLVPGTRGSENLDVDASLQLARVEGVERAVEVDVPPECPVGGARTEVDHF
jgi:hypothetical protein